MATSYLHKFLVLLQACLKAVNVQLLNSWPRFYKKVTPLHLNRAYLCMHSCGNVTKYVNAAIYKSHGRFYKLV